MMENSKKYNIYSIPFLCVSVLYFPTFHVDSGKIMFNDTKTRRLFRSIPSIRYHCINIKEIKGERNTGLPKPNCTFWASITIAVIKMHFSKNLCRNKCLFQKNWKQNHNSERNRYNNECKSHFQKILRAWLKILLLWK